MKSFRLDGRKHITIPTALLTNKRYFPKILSRGGERPFDLYLLLLKLQKEAQQESKLPKTFTISTQAITDGLHLADHQAKRYYGITLIRSQKALAETYRLINYKIAPNCTRIITMRNIRNISKDDRLPQEIYLPFTYWTYGWDKALSLRAKLCLLTAFLRDQSGTSLAFPLSIKSIAKYFHMDAKAVSLGQNELAKNNILEIRNPAYSKNFETFGNSNKYILKGLPDPIKREQRIAAMAADYGTRKTRHARKLAEMVDAENNPDDIQKFLHLMAIYGTRRVTSAARHAGNYLQCNAYRNVHAIGGYLRKEFGKRGTKPTSPPSSLNELRRSRRLRRSG